MKNTTSKFPAEIDDRIFFQDINVSQIPVMNDYYQYLNAENYTKASELLNNSEVFFYGAWLLNLLENRLYVIESHLINTKKNKLTEYSDSQPVESELYNGMNWVGDDVLN